MCSSLSLSLMRVATPTEAHIRLTEKALQPSLIPQNLSESLANLVRILRVAQCGSKLRVRDLPVVVLVGVLLGDGEDVLVREG